MPWDGSFWGISTLCGRNRHMAAGWALRIGVWILAIFLFTEQALPQGLTEPAQKEELSDKSRRAREALGAGRFDEAISLYRELVKALPGIPGLRMNLGMAYYMAGRFRESIPPLEAALKGDPRLTEALLFLGAGQREVGNLAPAVANLRKYVAHSPKDPRGRQLLGEALLAQQKFEQAAGQFEALGALEPENPRAWHGTGRSYEALAGVAFESLEKAAPDSAYWFALVASSRMAQQQYRSAFFFFRKALEKDPSLRGIHVAVSTIYRQTGHPEWAAQEEQKEVELGLPDCGTEKFVCDFLEGKHLEVIRELKKTETPKSLYWRSQAYNQLALDAFSRLGALPPSFELHELTAEIHRNQGRHREAVEEWEKALKLAPGNFTARRELAISKVLLHDYQGAQPLVDSLLEDDPNSALLNYLAGDIQLNQQRPADAITKLKRAVETDSGLLQAHASLGRAYMSLGETDKAIPHLKSALAVDRDGSLHYQLARAYRSAGNLQLAGQMLAKYQEIQKSLAREKETLEEEVRITPP